MTQRHAPRHARARHSAHRHRRALARWWVVSIAVVVGLATALAFGGWAGGTTSPTRALSRPPATTTTTTTTPTTTTTAPPSIPVPPVPGGVFAVGDSVLVDAQGPLAADVPGIVIDASVDRQWGTGESLVSQARARGITGAMIVFLGTNGPISGADVDAMMAAAAGVRRVVFVTEHVPRPWQDTNNAVLAAGVARHPNAVLADWYALSTPHPEWFYAGDGIHMPIGGPGAQALAALLAQEVG